MSTVIPALLPVLLVTLIGVILRRVGFLSNEGWAAIDKTCYFVLFPAIIFKEIAVADFTGVPVAAMAVALMLAIATMAVVLLALRPRICGALTIDGPAFTSLFQGATRWNALIALSIIPLTFGPGALALGAVAVAAMIPLLNIVNVGVLSLYGSGRSIEPREVARALATNPHLLSSLAGVVWKLLGLPLPPIAIVAFDLLGKGALGLALLAVGAGLGFAGTSSDKASLFVATALKLLVMPVFVFVWLELLGVSGPAAAVALLCGSVPSAASAYVLAQRMGGDGPLMAQIVTLQTICSAATLPIILYLANRL